MSVAPAVSWRPGMLATIETELIVLRRNSPDVGAAFAVAFAQAAGEDAVHRFPKLWAAGTRLVDAVNATSRDDVLDYHNRHHVAEAVLSMGWLAGAARRIGAIAPMEAALGVVAMVGHDLLHDGTPPNGGILEARSAEATLNATGAVPLDCWSRDVLRAVVLGTDPALVALNAARAAGQLPVGPFGAAIDLVVAIANEADVLTSLLPELGWRQAASLAAEWRRGGHARAESVPGYANRLIFLRIYAHCTPPARQIGLGNDSATDRSF